MSSEATCPITLTVAGDPRLARLVRMTAANVGALCSMSVDRIEDIRMAAEEAFIFGCTAVDSDDISIKFDVDESHVCMTFTFGDQAPSTRMTRLLFMPSLFWRACATPTKRLRRP